MSGKSARPTQQVTTIQRVEYKGILPPPEMLRQFQEFDQSLPTKLVDMADRNLKMQEKELEVYSERSRSEMENERAEIENERAKIVNESAELEVKELAVREQSRQTFKTQLAYLASILIFLGATVLLAERGYSSVAIAVATGGFLAMISNTLIGAHSKKNE
jgi:uncharacterized membrane protein